MLREAQSSALCEVLCSGRGQLLGLSGSRALPWLAIALTILIWAGYLVAVRAAASTSELTPVDVGLLRSVPAALLLLPFTLRRGLFPANADWKDIVAIGLIGGTLFTLLLGSGAHFAPVADAGIFAPSFLPVFVAVLSILFLATGVSASQFAGLALIVFGAVAVGGFEAIGNAADGSWRGHLLFMAASMSWAIYTVRFRASKLGPLEGAMILVTWAALIFLALSFVIGSAIFRTPGPVLAVQLALGLSAGLVANFTYLYAVRALGPAIPAASAALVPVVAAIGGWVFLEEPIGAIKSAGIAIVALGVLLASGITGQARR